MPRAEQKAKRAPVTGIKAKRTKPKPKPKPKPKRKSPETPPNPPVNGGGSERIAVKQESKTRRTYYEAAKTLFVERSLSLHEIQNKKLLPCSYTTLRRWYREGSWEKLRQLRAQGPQSMLPALELAMRKMVEAMTEQLERGKLPEPKWWDGMQKAVSVIEKLTGEAYFPAHLSRTLELLAGFLETTGKSELLKQLADHLEAFTVYALKPR